MSYNEAEEMMDEFDDQPPAENISQGSDVDQIIEPSPIMMELDASESNGSNSKNEVFFCTQMNPNVNVGGALYSQDSSQAINYSDALVEDYSRQTAVFNIKAMRDTSTHDSEILGSGKKFMLKPESTAT